MVGLASADKLNYGAGLPATADEKVTEAEQKVCRIVALCLEEVDVTADVGQPGNAVESYQERQPYREPPDHLQPQASSVLDLLPDAFDQAPVQEVPTSVGPVDLPQPAGNLSNVSELPEPLPDGEAICRATDQDQAAPGVVEQQRGEVCRAATGSPPLRPDQLIRDPRSIADDHVENASEALPFVEDLVQQLLGQEKAGDVLEMVPDPAQDTATGLSERLEGAISGSTNWSELPDEMELQIQTRVHVPGGPDCVNTYAGGVGVPNAINVHEGCGSNLAHRPPDLLVEVTSGSDSASSSSASGTLDILRLQEDLPVTVTVRYDLTKDTVPGEDAESRTVALGFAPGRGQTFPETVHVPFDVQWGQDSGTSASFQPEMSGVPSSLTLGARYRRSDGSAYTTRGVSATMRPVPTTLTVGYKGTSVEDGRRREVTWDANREVEGVLVLERETGSEAGLEDQERVSIAVDRLPRSFQATYQTRTCPACEETSHEFGYQGGARLKGLQAEYHQIVDGNPGQSMALAAPKLPPSLVLSVDPGNGEVNLTVDESIPRLDVQYRDRRSGLPAEAVRRVDLSAREIPSGSLHWARTDERARVRYNATGGILGSLEAVVASSLGEVRLPSAPSFAVYKNLGAAGGPHLLAALRIQGVDEVEAIRSGSSYDVRLDVRESLPFAAVYERRTSHQPNERVELAVRDLPRTLQASFDGRRFSYSAEDPVDLIQASGHLRGYDFSSKVKGVPDVPITATFSGSGSSGTFNLTQETDREREDGRDIQELAVASFEVVNEAGLGGSNFRSAAVRAEEVPLALSGSWTADDRQLSLSTNQPGRLEVGRLTVEASSQVEPSRTTSFLEKPGDGALYVENQDGASLAAEVTGLQVVEIAWPERNLPEVRLKSTGSQPFIGHFEAGDGSGGLDVAHLTVSSLPRNVDLRPREKSSATDAPSRDVNWAFQVATSDPIQRLTLEADVGSLGIDAVVEELPALMLEATWDGGATQAQVSLADVTWTEAGEPHAETGVTPAATVGSVALRVANQDGFGGTQFKEARISARTVSGGFTLDVAEREYTVTYESGEDAVKDVDLRATTEPGRYYRTSADRDTFDPRAGAYYAHTSSYRAFRVRVQSLDEMTIHYTPNKEFNLNASIPGKSPQPFLLKYHATGGEAPLRGLLEGTISDLPRTLNLNVVLDANRSVRNVTIETSDRIGGVHLQAEDVQASQNGPKMSGTFVARGISPGTGWLDLEGGATIEMTQQSDVEGPLLSRLAFRGVAPEGFFDIGGTPIVRAGLTVDDVPEFRATWNSSDRTVSLEALGGSFGTIETWFTSETDGRIEIPGQHMFYNNGVFPTDSGEKRATFFSARVRGLQKAKLEVPRKDRPFNVTADLAAGNDAPFLGYAGTHLSDGQPGSFDEMDWVLGNLSNLPEHVTFEGLSATDFTMSTNGRVEHADVFAHVPSRDVDAILGIEQLRPVTVNVDVADNSISIAPRTSTPTFADRVTVHVQSPSGNLPLGLEYAHLDVEAPTNLTASWDPQAGETGDYHIRTADGVPRIDLAASWGDCWYGPPQINDNAAFYMRGEVRCRTHDGKVRTIENRALTASLHNVEEARVHLGEEAPAEGPGECDGTPIDGGQPYPIVACFRFSQGHLANPRPVYTALHNGRTVVSTAVQDVPRTTRLNLERFERGHLKTDAGGADLDALAMVTDGPVRPWQGPPDRQSVTAAYTLNVDDIPKEIRFNLTGDGNGGNLSIEMSSGLPHFGVTGWDRDRNYVPYVEEFFLRLNDVGQGTSHIEWGRTDQDSYLRANFPPSTGDSPGRFLDVGVAQEGSIPDLPGGSSTNGFLVTKDDCMAGRLSLAEFVERLNVTFRDEQENSEDAGSGGVGVRSSCPPPDQGTSGPAFSVQGPQVRASTSGSKEAARSPSAEEPARIDLGTAPPTTEVDSQLGQDLDDAVPETNPRRVIASSPPASSPNLQLEQHDARERVLADAPIPEPTAKEAQGAPLETPTLVVTLSDIPERVEILGNGYANVGEEVDASGWEGPWNAQFLSYKGSEPVDAEAEVWVPNIVDGVPLNLYLKGSAHFPSRLYAERPLLKGDAEGPGPEGQDRYLYYRASSREDAPVTHEVLDVGDGRIAGPVLHGPPALLDMRLSAGVSAAGAGSFGLELGLVEGSHLDLKYGQGDRFFYLDTGGQDFEFLDPGAVFSPLNTGTFRAGLEGTVNTDPFYLPFAFGVPNPAGIEGNVNKLCLFMKVQVEGPNGTVTLRKPIVATPPSTCPYDPLEVQL